MRIEHSLRASKTPAFALLAEGWNELVQGGLTPEGRGVSPVEPDNEVRFAVSDEGDIVGVLAFSLKAAVCTVTLVYVEHSCRRRGLFKALLAKLKALGASYGVDRIQMEAPIENAPFQATMRRLNSTVITVSYDLTG